MSLHLLILALSLPMALTQDVYRANVLRADVYRVQCPGRVTSTYQSRAENVTVKSRIACVALCQRDSACSAVEYTDGQCTLVTSNETECESRDHDTHGNTLERTRSNWCSHGQQADGQQADGQVAHGHRYHDNCTCSPPYVGRFCSIDVHAVDECMEGCEHGGTCEDGWDTFTCHCAPGFTGERCGTDLCAGACDHGAQCLPTATDVTCICRAGFSGDRCEEVGRHALVGGSRTVTMWDPYTEGDWGSWDTCAAGSYAAGIQLRIQPGQGSDDDSAVNAIWLLCREAWGSFTEVSSISSNTMYWGDLQGKLYCPPDYWIVSYRLYYEPYQGGASDDTGVNGLEVACRGPGMSGTGTMQLKQSMTWGASEWSSWSDVCERGTAVCSLKTRVEQDQGSLMWVDVDDGALTGAEMQCCNY